MDYDKNTPRGQLVEEALNNPFFRNRTTKEQEEFVDWGTANAERYTKGKTLDTQAAARDWISGKILA